MMFICISACVTGACLCECIYMRSAFVLCMVCIYIIGLARVSQLSQKEAREIDQIVQSAYAFYRLALKLEETKVTLHAIGGDTTPLVGIHQIHACRHATCTRTHCMTNLFVHANIDALAH